MGLSKLWRGFLVLSKNIFLILFKKIIRRRKVLERIKIFQEAVFDSVETEIRYDDVPFVHVGTEPKFYSIYWESPLKASEFVLFAKKFVKLTVDCMMYTESRPENAPYKFEELVAEKIMHADKLDKECSFLRIYGDSFDLTWHVEKQLPELTIVGLVSDKLNIGLFREIFQGTTRKPVPDDVLIIIEKLLGRF